MADLLKPIKDDIKQVYTLKLGADDVVFGDKTANKVKAHIDLSKWNGEEHLIISHPDFDGISSLDNDKILISNTDQDFYAFQFDETTLKFGLIFKTKPASNIITFQLEGWENFNFWYQGIWQNVEYYIQDGKERVRNLDEKDHPTRPIDVQGSYAIYHKIKKNNQYKVGKFGHIFRPRFIDANSNWVWGDLNIKDGIYTVTIPQSFLDKAVYPVKANDTLGNTNFGAGDGGISANVLKAMQFTAVANGTVTSITAGSNYTVGSHVKGCIYSDNGSNLPANLLAYTYEGSTVSYTWFTMNLVSNYNITNTTKYFIGIFAGGNYDYPYDTGTTEIMGGTSDALTYSTFPNPMANQITEETGRIWSIYATYTAGETFLTGVHFFDY